MSIFLDNQIYIRLIAQASKLLFGSLLSQAQVCGA